jgi:hypothetical protein
MTARTATDAFGTDGSEGTDPFGTASLRRRVLDAWAAAPARFREDANAEEELALGGYRDRLVVELAQNAADAARRVGVPGRLRLTLRGGVLAAANTGAHLDAEGVESLSTLRASSKREERDAGAVGRFGVGFSAVLSVTDEPSVIGVPGGVRWSLAEARQLAAEAAQRPGADAGLTEELRRREGHVPLLRLPLPAEGTPPVGYDTVVLLPLRDAAAEDLTRRLLDDTDDALLLALPGLAEVVIETEDGARTLARRSSVRESGAESEAELATGSVAEDEVVIADDESETRWQVLSRGGALDAALLADRTTEERHRPFWSLTWAVPVDDAGDPVRVRTAYLHAPTPSDEPLGLPALLIASFPLDSTRRHVAPGPLTDFLVEQAADAYAELVRRRGASLGSLRLVPAPLGKGELDAKLRRAILARLPETPFLPEAGQDKHSLPEVADEKGETALRPRDAVLLEGADAQVVRALAAVLPGLLPAGLERRQELRALEVRRVALAETVDQLANLDREPEWWRNLYGSLTGADPEALGALPVPLADGRMVRGPRRVLVSAAAPGEEGPVRPEDLEILGLRLTHPDAAHPLLEKLGAGVATPAGVLETPELRAAVARSADLDDEEEAEELAEAVLRVVQSALAEGGLTDGQYPWLARLALTDEEGEWTPAGELVLPGSPLAAVAHEDDAVFLDEELVERWGADVLRAVGVAHSFGLLRAEEAVLDPDDLERFDPTVPADRALGGEPAALLDEAPDGLADWAEDVTEPLLNGDDLPPGVPAVPPVAAELLAVRDLDLVDDGAWPQALALLAQPPLRSAVVDRVRLLLPDGRSAEVIPYAAWWLRDHPVLDGRAPAGLRAAGGDKLLRGLYDEARTELDEAFLHALGVRTTLTALLEDPDGPDDVLDRLADADRPVGHRQLHGIYTALATVPLDRIPLPDEVRALPPLDPATHRRPAHTVIVDVADAVVADAPDLVQLLDDFPLITVAPALAPALAERLHVSLASEIAGGRVLTEGTVRAVPEEIRELLPGCPAVYEEHEELLVVGPDGEEAPVGWRWDAESEAPALPEGEGASDDEPDEFAPVVPFGTLHAATPEGLAAGLSWAASAWQRRFEVLALLGDPDRAYELSAARDFEG